MEELPNYFDVIVVGTGMPECIIAAAAARIGRTVLHLERNSYYGGDWASFSFDKLLEWVEETKSNLEKPTNENNSNNLTSFLKENERLALCRLKSNSITNISIKSYICGTLSEGSILSASVPEVQVTTFETSALNERPGETFSDISTPAGLQHEWTISQLIENRRKFNIDLSPKIMFSRGSLVELLISSNIARYAEFQCINRVLTYINDRIEQVPCSRADVFSTKNVTVVEKRMLMKFLTFCLKFEEHAEQYKGFEEVPFVQFLRSKKLTPNVEHYILHAIAMADASGGTLEGLRRTQRFLQSLERYGKSPFLCTCYGSAELPQCFCRLCAVYGGMYYLKRDTEAVLVQEGQCRGIVSRDQRIDCQWLVMESSYCPSEFVAADEKSERISRGVFITDNSLYPGEKKENVLLRLPPGPDRPSVVTVLEFSSKTYVCPEDLYVVYMYCRSSRATAEEDLKPVADLLFRAADSEETESSPRVLWRLFFNQDDSSYQDVSRVPPGMFVTSNADIELDYDHAVRQAEEIFAKLAPGEAFLERAPDPEDILIENHVDPGEKMENDVEVHQGDGPPHDP